jgi:hypothetical protein
MQQLWCCCSNEALQWRWADEPEGLQRAGSIGSVWDLPILFLLCSSHA